MATLPDNVTYGHVIGRFLVDAPEDTPATGKVRFVPAAAHLQNLQSTPPTTIVLEPVICGDLDIDGDVVDPITGAKGVDLIATDNADIYPVNWTWAVQISIAGRAVSKFNMALPGGETVDLAAVIPLSAASGDPPAIIVGPPGPGGGGGSGTVSDVVWVDTDEPTDENLELWYDTDAVGDDGDTGMSGPTVDTDEEFRVILFSDGTVTAIPVAATNPGLPTDLARVVRVNSVKLTWTAPVGAATYAVYRNSVAYATSTTNSYRDIVVTVGEIYTYAVQAISAYGLRSGITTTVTAYVDPALNIAPTVEVRTWPATVAVDNRAVVRVNAIDADAQLLALTLGVDVGTLIATADPSVWILVP